jgi:hypothetical protein
MLTISTLSHNRTPELIPPTFNILPIDQLLCIPPYSHQTLVSSIVLHELPMVTQQVQEIIINLEAGTALKVPPAEANWGDNSKTPVAWREGAVCIPKGRINLPNVEIPTSLASFITLPRCNSLNLHLGFIFCGWVREPKWFPRGVFRRTISRELEKFLQENICLSSLTYQFISLLWITTGTLAWSCVYWSIKLVGGDCTDDF